MRRRPISADPRIGCGRLRPIHGNMGICCREARVIGRKTEIGWRGSRPTCRNTEIDYVSQMIATLGRLDDHFGASSSIRAPLDRAMTTIGSRGFPP
jgi:hypothetical protein